MGTLILRHKAKSAAEFLAEKNRSALAAISSEVNPIQGAN